MNGDKGVPMQNYLGRVRQLINWQHYSLQKPIGQNTSVVEIEYRVAQAIITFPKNSKPHVKIFGKPLG
jgi:hypothetical protein